MNAEVSMEVGVVADPELRFSGAGKPWVKFRGVYKDRKNEGGQWVDGDAHYIDVIVFGRSAENVAESLVKGDTALVFGRLQIREYDKEGGGKGKAVEVVASAIGNSLLWNPAPTRRAERATSVNEQPAQSPEDDRPF